MNDAPEKTIRLTIDLTYDPESMHGDDPKSIEWFQSILNGNDLQLGEFGDLGDMIGTVKVVDCTPTDERVKALEDGRPCSTDIWMAAAIQQIDDKWDFFDACKCWAEGDWDGAMEGVSLPNQPRAALRDMGVE